jgi:hypothetical protein
MVDQACLKDLYQSGFLSPHPLNVKHPAKTFWNCFAESYEKNKNGADGKCRILSIIAQEFTYHDLQEKLGVNIIHLLLMLVYMEFYFK